MKSFKKTTAIVFVLHSLAMSSFAHAGADHLSLPQPRPAPQVITQNGGGVGETAIAKNTAPKGNVLATQNNGSTALGVATAKAILTPTNAFVNQVSRFTTDSNVIANNPGNPQVDAKYQNLINGDTAAIKLNITKLGQVDAGVLTYIGNNASAFNTPTGQAFRTDASKLQQQINAFNTVGLNVGKVGETARAVDTASKNLVTALAQYGASRAATQTPASGASNVPLGSAARIGPVVETSAPFKDGGTVTGAPLNDQGTVTSPAQSQP